MKIFKTYNKFFFLKKTHLQIRFPENMFKLNLLNYKTLFKNIIYNFLNFPATKWKEKEKCKYSESYSNVKDDVATIVYEW